MRKFKGEIALYNGKYSVKYPVEVEASVFSTAMSRAASYGLKVWKKNGHRKEPVEVDVRLSRAGSV